MGSKEIWVDINNYEGLYQVSNYGRVKSLKRSWTTGLGTRSKEETFLKLIHDAYGYHVVTLCKNSKVKHIQVHRLVAESFIDNPCNKKVVNHLNGIKDDNRMCNLEWCTFKENTIHAYETGLMEKVKKAVRISNSKRTGSNSVNKRQIIDTKTKKVFDTIKQAANFYQMKYGTLLDMLRGRLKNRTSLKYLKDYE